MSPREVCPWFENAAKVEASFAQVQRRRKYQNTLCYTPLHVTLATLAPASRLSRWYKVLVIGVTSCNDIVPTEPLEYSASPCHHLHELKSFFLFVLMRAGLFRCVGWGEPAALVSVLFVAPESVVLVTVYPIESFIGKRIFSRTHLVSVLMHTPEVHRSAEMLKCIVGC